MIFQKRTSIVSRTRKRRAQAESRENIWLLFKSGFPYIGWLLVDVRFLALDRVTLDPAFQNILQTPP